MPLRTQPAAPRQRRLIKTKLNPPGGFQRALQRNGLRQLLDPASRPFKLVTVAAPAGYGKSTLLAQWHSKLEEEGVPSGWLSLDADDNDPVRFVTYVLGALRCVTEASGSSTITQNKVAWRSVLEPLLLALVQDLQEVDRPFVLFLDDFHCISEQSVHEALDWLISHSPPPMTFVVASRTVPALAVNALKLSGALLELEMRDLSFRVEEAQLFLNDLQGHRLNPDEVTAIVERTEGWITGLSLVSLALKNTQDCSRFIEEFSGSDRAITDYLGEAVLRRLGAEVRDFLLSTSLLERLCADLCREVSGREDSQRLLERIEAENLFLVPLDRERKWYRYHHLFADFLKTRLLAEHPERIRDTYRVASRWFGGHGYAREAIRFAFLGEDFEQAGDLIESVWEDLVQHRGEHATLLDWMRRLPDSCVDARPKLRIGHAWSLTFTRQYAQADKELKKLEDQCNQKGDLDTRNAADRSNILSTVEMIRCVLYALTDKPNQCRAASEGWLERWPDAPWFDIGTVSSTLAYTCMVRHEFERGRDAVAKARAAFENCRGYYGIAWDDAIGGIMLLQQGRLREAVSTYRGGLAFAAKKLGPRSYAGSLLSVLLAEALYERDELDEAKVYLDASFPMVNDHGAVETALAGYVTKARLLYQQGHQEAMEAALVEGERLGERLGLSRLVTSLAAERISLHLRWGGVEKARSLAESSGFFAPQEMSSSEEIAQLVRARLWTAAGEASRAVGVLGELVALARRRGRTRKAIELLVARALAFEQCGSRGAALRTLDAAVRLAAPEGFCRVFLDEGPALRELIEEMIRTRPKVPGEEEKTIVAHLTRLARGSAAEPEALSQAQEVPVVPDSTASPMEPLTRREVEVLKLLRTGLSNRDLARTLFVSETTVKWHLRNLYGKLGVRSRTGALARAGQLGLI
jgi:LuxR family maltose regulon positive regulatory protein